MRPVIYAVGGTDRTRHVARAMVDGFDRHGIPAKVLDTFDGEVKGDIAIAYGWNHERIFKAYPNYAYFDLGYWDRRPKRDKKDGYHRLAVNSWDTVDNMLIGCPADRLAMNPAVLKPWCSKGDSILVAGMSDKAAGTHGFLPGQWERETVEHLRQITDRPIELRAKPKGSKPEGDPIEVALARSHFVVSHHSNVSVDAMIAGVPFWCRRGVGRLHSPLDLTASVIENPTFISTRKRQQTLQDLAYAQWRPSEMQTGQVWDVIKWILVSMQVPGSGLSNT